MADYIVTSGELTTVANAIREKNGTSSSLSWPNGFVSGISSGGSGGSSDFSTAEVTIIVGENTPDDSRFMMPVLMDEDGYIYIDGGDVLYHGSNSYTAVLYQGYTSFNTLVVRNGVITIGNFTISVTGNASVVANNLVSITGNCTITISATQ